MAEQLLNGLILGSIYALMGSGLTLVYGTMRVLNFAHGEFYMLGGYAFLLLTTGLGLHPALAVILAALCVFAFAAGVGFGVIRPLLDKPGWEFSTIAATMGLSIVLQNLALGVWGETFRSVPYFTNAMLEIGDIRMPYQRLLIAIVAAAAIGGTALLLRHTRFGSAIRATAQDPEAARIMGVRTGLVNTLSFALGAALAAVAAAMLSPLYAVNPWMGVTLSLKAFAVVVMGGLGSFTGCIAAGMILGVVEAVGVGLTSSEWREVISFGILIAVIWWRPWGLFGVGRAVR
ncbi:MAG: branched-chain amino acid ABC transporter permease [Zavarzinia sp.]|nr:branched-chain amino acid ABC transporter permease [Zavarzinia sp.]